jgi:hypothetical protein
MLDSQKKRSQEFVGVKGRGIKIPRIDQIEIGSDWPTLIWMTPSRHASSLST